MVRPSSVRGGRRLLLRGQPRAAHPLAGALLDVLPVALVVVLGGGAGARVRAGGAGAVVGAGLGDAEALFLVRLRGGRAGVGGHGAEGEDGGEGGADEDLLVHLGLLDGWFEVRRCAALPSVA